MAKKEVTNKQRIILLLIYIFRFLNSKQIQEFLRHKDHRRINSWLKELGDTGYLERDYEVIYGKQTKPAVYNLSAKGRQYIKHGFPYFFTKYLTKIARDNKASKGFKIKCQVIADLYLLWFPPIEEKQAKITYIKNKKKLKMQLTGITIVDKMIAELTTDDENSDTIAIKERQFFTSSYFPDFILLEKLKPDGYFRKRTKDGIIHALFFVLDAYIPRFLLRYTLKRIFDTLDEEYWNDDDLASLRFYLVCPNNVIITYMRRMLKSTMERYYESKELTFCFATRNQLYKEKKYPEKEVEWTVISSEDEEY